MASLIPRTVIPNSCRVSPTYNSHRNCCSHPAHRIQGPQQVGLKVERQRADVRGIRILVERVHVFITYFRSYLADVTFCTTWRPSACIDQKPLRLLPHKNSRRGLLLRPQAETQLATYIETDASTHFSPVSRSTVGCYRLVIPAVCCIFFYISMHCHRTPSLPPTQRKQNPVPVRQHWQHPPRQTRPGIPPEPGG